MKLLECTGIKMLLRALIIILWFCCIVFAITAFAMSEWVAGMFWWFTVVITYLMDRKRRKETK